MKKNPPPTPWLRRLTVAGAALGAALSAQAGTNTFNFDTDPIGILKIVGNRDTRVWSPSGGNPGGYLAITDSVNSEYAGVLFDDFDAGLVVAAFNITADVRVGNPIGNAGRPADGFSVSYARNGDPLIADMEADSGATGNFAGGIPEAGSTTGLAVSFDTWSGNTLPDGGDIEGLIVRVDNVTLVRVNLPTRNGACDDNTSLQTGPWSGGNTIDDPGAGSPAGLCWQKVEVDLTEAGNLKVVYKGRTILDQAVAYAPSRGRLILAGRTGGANENTHFDNLRIVTLGADNVIIGQLVANPIGFTIATIDSGQGVSDTNTVQLVFNGAPVTATRITKADGTTTIGWENVAAPLAIGSTNTVVLTIRDTIGRSKTETRTFVTAPYVTIPASYAVTGVNTAQGGFNFKVHQTAIRNQENTIARAEQQLQNLRGGNVASTTLPGFTGNVYAETAVINYSQPTTDGVTPEQNGFFRENVNEPTLSFPDVLIPGIPSATEFNPDSSFYTDNIAAEITSYVHFAAPGAYNVIFNSDDGFRTTVSDSLSEVLTSIIVSEADIGRGSVDSVATIYVPVAGYYPFRSVWFEGGGGANLEWSSQRLAPDPTARRLVNGTEADALKSYRSRTGSGPAAASFLHPFRGSGNPYFGTVPLVAKIEDGATAVDQASIKLFLNGTEVPATKQKAGTTTTVTYDPPGNLPGGANTVILQFTAGAQSYGATNSFTVRSTPVIAPSLAMPAAAVNTGNIGFLIKTVQQNSGESMGTDIYRALVHFAGFIGFPNIADLSQFTGPNGSYVETAVINYTQSGDSGYWVTANGYTDALVPGIPSLTAGAADNGTDNYTQEILTVLDLQPGVYAFNVNSDDGFINTIGNPAEAFTLPQVVGEFNAGRGVGAGFADGTTYTFEITQAGLYPMRNLWFEGGGGSGIEWSFFAVDPATGALTNKTLINDANVTGAIKAYQYPVNNAGVPYVKSFLPARSGWASGVAPARSGPDAQIKVVLAKAAGTIATNAITLAVDATPVTPTITETASEVTVTYAPAGGWAPNTSHNASLTFTGRTVSWDFQIGSISTPSFFLEAEDFDRNGAGQPAASVMPYIGGAYSGLDAADGVDYLRANEGSSPIYRMGEDPQVPMDRTGDRDRGASELAVNYKIGWVGGGQWYNFTRTFPAGTYNVYAGLSHGDASTTATRIGGNLATVAGGTPTVVGAFDGPATGGWGNNALVPLRDTATTNNLVAVNLSGQQTVRFNTTNGDFDFILFVPEGVSRPQITSVTISGGNVTVVWTGGGTLEIAPAVTGPWTDTGDGDGSYTAPVQGAAAFGRIKRAN